MSPPSLAAQGPSFGVAGRPLLTVLTTPIRSTPARWYRAVRRAVRPLVKPGAPLPAQRTYHGHESLVRSVVHGLRAIGADFNFEPDRFGAVGRVVYAPANEALAQAIELKRRGRISALVAGPVNALFPDDCNGILKSPEIDVVIAPSEWVRRFYQHEPALNRKVRICQAGIDEQYWNRTSPPISNRALVYWKSGSEAFCEEVEHRVGQHGLEPRRIQYGAYDRDAYQAALSEATVAVFLSSFETQGLALAEAWSMDVPTVVLDPQAPTEWRGRPFVAGSSCPFLSPATGRSWQTLPDLSIALEDVLKKRDTFAPRAWVLQHMTDAICAAELYRIIRDSAASR